MQNMICFSSTIAFKPFSGLTLSMTEAGLAGHCRWARPYSQQ
jgi:hypothetical protein